MSDALLAHAGVCLPSPSQRPSPELEQWLKTLDNLSDADKMKEVQAVVGALLLAKLPHPQPGAPPSSSIIPDKGTLEGQEEGKDSSTATQEHRGATNIAKPQIHGRLPPTSPQDKLITTEYPGLDINAGSARLTLEGVKQMYMVVDSNEQRFRALVNQLMWHEGEQSVVYCNNPGQVEDVVVRLRAIGVLSGGEIRQMHQIRTLLTFCCNRYP